MRRGKGDRTTGCLAAEVQAEVAAKRDAGRLAAREQEAAGFANQPGGAAEKKRRRAAKKSRRAAKQAQAELAAHAEAATTRRESKPRRARGIIGRAAAPKAAERAKQRKVDAAPGGTKRGQGRAKVKAGKNARRSRAKRERGEGCAGGGGRRPGGRWGPGSCRPGLGGLCRLGRSARALPAREPSRPGASAGC